MDKQEHDRAGDPQFLPAGSSGVGQNVYLSLDQLKTQVTEHVTDSFRDKLQARDTQLVSSIGTLIDSKLESLRTEISQKASYLKYNEPKTFKCKGNEKQFNINGQIIDQLEIASEHLEASKLNKVRDTLAEGMRILKERQKLILISDSDKHGWKVAEEYETHILAENKEGEKRLWKAEQRAEKKSQRGQQGEAQQTEEDGPYHI